MKFPLIVLRRILSKKQESFEKWTFMELLLGRNYELTPYFVTLIFLILFLITLF